jgi:hypothetical protein
VYDKYRNIVDNRRYEKVEMVMTVMSADESCHATVHVPRPNIQYAEERGLGTMKNSDVDVEYCIWGMVLDVEVFSTEIQRHLGTA